MFTKERVVALVEADTTGSVIERAVYTVWMGQTADEKVTAEVRHGNRKGFAVRTKRVGTQLGRYLQAAVDRAGGDLSRVKWGTIIYSPRLQVEAKEIARHHAAQVAKVWNEMNRAKAA